MDVFFQNVIETLNVVINNGLSNGACTLDLISPPKVNYGDHKIVNVGTKAVLT